MASSWAQNIRNKVLSNLYKTQQKDECNLFGIKDEFWICEDKPEYLEAITFWVNETYYYADNFYINHLIYFTKIYGTLTNEVTMRGCFSALHIDFL